MNCKHYEALLDSYVQGELDQRVAADVGAHVSMCFSCGRCYDAVLREEATLRQYLNEIDAAPNLWARVNDGIAQVNSRSNTGFIDGWFERQFPAFLKSAPARMAFASVLALVIIGITFKTLTHTNTSQHDSDKIVFNEPSPNPVRENLASDTPKESRQPIGSIREISTGDNKQRSKVPVAIDSRPATGTRPELRASTIDTIRIAEQQYSAAIARLSRDFVHHRKQLDRTAVEQFEQTLAKLDVTIAATRRAAYGDPRNPQAVQYLMTAYARKVDALRQIIAA